MTAGRTRPAGVVCGNRQHIAAEPNLLVFQLPPELEPSLIEDGLVQARFGFDVTPWRIAAACCGFGHIPYLQVLDTHHRVVFADCGRGLVQEIAASIGDAGVNLLDAGFRSERCIQPATAEGKAGLEKAVLEKCVVVAIVLCLFMRRCADQHY